MKRIWLIAIWVAVFLVFWVRGAAALDPDFGWHYRMGSLIITSGVPKTDPFSYTMPDYRFVDHEWLTDVVMNKLYEAGGTMFLAFIWSGLALLAINVALQGRQKSGNFKILIPVLLLTAGLLVNQFGVRPQVLSWVMFAALMWLLRKIDTKPFAYAVPFLFLIWANTHGSFGLGIVVLTVYLFVKSFKLPQKRLFYFVIILLSTLGTLVNPYGIYLWKEIVSTFFSPELRSGIAEWKPIWTSPLASFFLFTGLFGGIVVRLGKHVKLEDAVIGIIVLAMSVSALINVPLFALASAAIVLDGIVVFKKQFAKTKPSNVRFEKVFGFLVAIALTLSLADALHAFNLAHSVSEDVFYPKGAVAYISRNIPSGQIFSVYNWGGYLIWKLPEKKVFIDGRMAHWDGIFADYTKIVEGSVGYTESFGKYNIHMVLWPKGAKPETLLNKVKENGWVVVYEDKVSEVLVKK